MLRVNFGPIQTRVIIKPKTAPARWKIRILGDRNSNYSVWAELNQCEMFFFVNDYDKLRLFWSNFVKR